LVQLAPGIGASMKKLVEITLGILTAIGGMIDIGNVVANPQAGARFGMALAWVIPLGVLGMMLYMEMASRVPRSLDAPCSTSSGSDWEQGWGWSI
jgi:hypothetical protein